MKPRRKMCNEAKVVPKDCTVQTVNIILECFIKESSELEMSAFLDFSREEGREAET